MENTINQVFRNRTRKYQDRFAVEKNAKLARFETLKRYRILKNDFSRETGESTPSLKLKRKVVQAMYAKEIESLYSSD